MQRACIAFVVGMFTCPCCFGCLNGDFEAVQLAKEHGLPVLESGKIVEVRITTRKAAVALCPVLHKLRHLDTLCVTGVRLKEDELQMIGQLENLKQLRLNFCKNTDDDLPSLTGLTNLQWLAINQSTITDNGLQHFSDMKELIILDLGVSNINGPGVDYLKELPNLRELRLSNGPLDDAGVEHCAKLKRLQSLWLSGTHVTDVGLMKLVDMVSLQYIDGNDLLTSEAMLKFRKLHQEKKCAARARGEVLPNDFSSPFGSVEAAQE